MAQQIEQQQIRQPQNISQATVRQAQETDSWIADLSKTAGRIGDVMDLMNAVALQRKLLTLTATIEAGCAGHVKMLAAQIA